MYFDKEYKWLFVFGSWEVIVDDVLLIIVVWFIDSVVLELVFGILDDFWFVVDEIRLVVDCGLFVV